MTGVQIITAAFIQFWHIVFSNYVAAWIEISSRAPLCEKHIVQENFTQLPIAWNLIGKKMQATLLIVA